LEAFKSRFQLLWTLLLYLNSLSSYRSLLSALHSFARLFQCAAVSKAREARQKKIQAYEAKKYAQARDAAALDPTGTAAGHLLEQAPSGKLDPNGNYDEYARQQAGGSDDGMTSPAHSDDDEPTDEATDNETTNNEADYSADNPHAVPLPVTSPMSVLSEQTAPELVSPPRILEKVDDDAQNTNDNTDVPSALKSAGLLCGCL
jgi:hypothetical protein